MKNLIISSICLITNIVFGQLVTTFHDDVSSKIDDGLILDKSGNLYGSHFNGNNVYKVTPNGISSIFASGFNTPNGLAFDSSENLFVCDMSGNRIYKIAFNGVFLDTFYITGPSGIIKEVDSDTMIFTQYISNQHFVNKLSPDGIISNYLTGSPLNGPVGLAYDDLSNLYIANFNDRKIFKVQADTLKYIATVPGNSNGWLGFITYAKGSLWGTSYNNHKIYKIYQDYQDSVELIAGTSIGSIDGDINVAKFYKPNGIISSITGDSLYVSEFGTGKIRILNLNSELDLKENTSSYRFQIYPNPVSDKLFIKGDMYFEKILIYNFNGQLLKSANNKEIDVSLLTKGLYIIQIVLDNQSYYEYFEKN